MDHLLSYFLLSLSFSLVCSESDRTYIVRVRNDAKPSVFPDVKDWYKATLQSLLNSNLLKTDQNSKPTQKATASLLHVYKTVFHGFSAKLTKQQAKQLLDKPGVITILPDRVLQLCTTRSPSFLGLYPLSSDNTNDISKAGRLLSESDSGSNVIIGFLDSGISPEHPSFNDEGMGSIPEKWKGQCNGGDDFICNNKIIGAWSISTSARDESGHGTHTASTAAGRAVGNASFFGYAKGIAVGVAPKARIAVYKVCVMLCQASNILAGLNKAVEDGVDVISMTIGDNRPMMYSLDPISIGAFGAMEKGVSFITPAGNDGPIQGSVANIAPWMTVVGASTIDRGFSADLVLGNGWVINGESLYSGKPLPENTTFPLIDGGNCMDFSSLDTNGKIVVCNRFGEGDGGKAVQRAGGRGVVVANMEGEGDDLIAESYIIPGLSIDETTSTMVRDDYINENKTTANATMLFHGTEFGLKPAPVVASLSSRGPNNISSYVQKPDLVAPGVNILAAWLGTGFEVRSGTSLSCPHVAGVAALLKGAHPDWTPAMIRSAMMTTAYTQDKDSKAILDSKDHMEATAWAMGAGHVNPEKAVDPGLVYNTTADDYLNFLCASGYTDDGIRNITNSPNTRCGEEQTQPWDLNYPAISVAIKASETLVVHRTVTYVGDQLPADYSVTVTNPKSVTDPKSGIISMNVDLMRMVFKGKGEKQSYSVTIQAILASAMVEGMYQGKIVWSDGRQHQVVSPVVAVWTKALSSLEP
ncbi:Calcium uptake protein 1, mitochondrial [Castilleja foliolosa]|uniref:Calcium uptake protein 1, mitochondrial n=1 Tax=Castilleja foliolosa TaxID=1961234 RepID=A0ABD3E4R0_9LAMI